MVMTQQEKMKIIGELLPKLKRLGYRSLEADVDKLSPEALRDLASLVGEADRRQVGNPTETD